MNFFLLQLKRSNKKEILKKHAFAIKNLGEEVFMTFLFTLKL